MWLNLCALCICAMQLNLYCLMYATMWLNLHCLMYSIWCYVTQHVLFLMYPLLCDSTCTVSYVSVAMWLNLHGLMHCCYVTQHLLCLMYPSVMWLNMCCRCLYVSVACYATQHVPCLRYMLLCNSICTIMYLLLYDSTCTVRVLCICCYLTQLVWCVLCIVGCRSRSVELMHVSEVYPGFYFIPTCFWTSFLSHPSTHPPTVPDCCNPETTNIRPYIASGQHCPATVPREQ